MHLRKKSLLYAREHLKVNPSRQIKMPLLDFGRHRNPAMGERMETVTTYTVDASNANHTLCIWVPSQHAGVLLLHNPFLQVNISPGPAWKAHLVCGLGPPFGYFAL